MTISEAKAELHEAHDRLSDTLEDEDAGNDEVRDAAIDICLALNNFYAAEEDDLKAKLTPARQPPPKPAWTVAAVSDNFGAFGHKGVIYLNEAGEVVELMLQAYGTTPLPKVGDELRDFPPSEVPPKYWPGPGLERAKQILAEIRSDLEKART